MLRVPEWPSPKSNKTHLILFCKHTKGRTGGSWRNDWMNNTLQTGGATKWNWRIDKLYSVTDKDARETLTGYDLFFLLSFFFLKYLKCQLTKPHWQYMTVLHSFQNKSMVELGFIEECSRPTHSKPLSRRIALKQPQLTLSATHPTESTHIQEE